MKQKLIFAGLLLGNFLLHSDLASGEDAPADDRISREILPGEEITTRSGKTVKVWSVQGGGQSRQPGSAEAGEKQQENTEQGINPNNVDVIVDGRSKNRLRDQPLPPTPSRDAPVNRATPQPNLRNQDAPQPSLPSQDTPRIKEPTPPVEPSF